MHMHTHIFTHTLLRLRWRHYGPLHRCTVAPLHRCTVVSVLLNGMRYHATPRLATPRHATPRHASTGHTVPLLLKCHVMPCHTFLCVCVHSLLHASVLRHRHREHCGGLPGRANGGLRGLGAGTHTLIHSRECLAWRLCAGSGARPCYVFVCVYVCLIV
jgi:hypothetical protein